jgi:YD repeat-containing protein
VTFGYDAAGNRTSMIDGLGSQSYGYDQLSRMTSETRTFTGVGNYTISYQYNLGNQLSSITSPHTSTVGYVRDASGRVISITGTAVPTIPTYASNIQYRAWGAVKHRNHPNGWAVDATFNSRMQAASFTVTSTISKTYDYYADGRLRFSSDHRDHRFDRYYTFDHAGRISEAFSGAEARFEAPTTNRPYRQTYGYDALGHLTGRDMKRWYLNWSMTDSYTNNRRGGWGYDADGRLTSGPEGPFTHDAAGSNTYVNNTFTGAYTGAFGYDGDGRLIKTVETTWDNASLSYITETKHFVRSSVLGGQVLTELLEGQSWATYVYAGTEVIAREWGLPPYATVSFDHKDPSGGTVWNWEGQQELDPTGADNGTHMYSEIADGGAFISQGSSYNPANPTKGYSIDGIRTTLDGFIGRLGHFANDPVALMEVASQPVGYRSTGYVSGRSF